MLCHHAVQDSHGDIFKDEQLDPNYKHYAYKQSLEGLKDYFVRRECRRGARMSCRNPGGRAGSQQAGGRADKQLQGCEQQKTAYQPSLINRLSTARCCTRRAGKNRKEARRAAKAAAQ
jgi:hypothetical protein